MLKLFKYEMRKTLFPKLVYFAFMLIVECVFLYGYWTDKNDYISLGLALLVLIILCGFMMFGILSLVTLHRDMNTRQGYMLFMTPNSTYRILGAKVAECGLTMLAAGALGLALGVLDYSLIEQEVEFITSLLRNFAAELVPTFPNVSTLLFYIICNILCSVTTAYLADVVSSSLLNGKKGNLVITFVLFIVINFVVQKIIGLVPDTLTISEGFLARGGVALALSAVMYVITAKLMDRYLSV